jgi:hypothetical protein
MPFCPSCGKDVTENTAFCPSCGRSFASSATRSPKAATPLRQTKMRRLILVVVVVVILVLAISLVYVFEFSTIPVTVSGSVTMESTAGVPVRIDFTSSSGQNYSAYVPASSVAYVSSTQLVRGQYSVSLPGHSTYRITVIFTTGYGSQDCDAGTMIVTGNNYLANIQC